MKRLCSKRSANVRHSVISFMDGGKHIHSLKEAGIAVTTLGLRQGRFTFKPLRELFYELRKSKPDVVQTWMYHADLIGGIAARAAGVPAVVWNVRHSDHDDRTTKTTTRIAAKLCARLSWTIPKRIVSCAHRAVALHTKAGYDPSRFIVIANGYDFDEFKIDGPARQKFRMEIGATERTPVIGAVGRWAPQKDHATLVAALALVKKVEPEVKGVLVGTGCDAGNARLVELLQQHGLSDSVSLLGPRDDIAAVMNGLDLHVLAASHGEAFPNVVAEAMACGTPCVVTDVGDAAMIVSTCGWVIEDRDDARRAEIRNCVVHRFSLDTTVAAYERLWSNCLNHPGHSSVA
jgi:glycosyltransferase involved in cell wall biosynthesis